VMDPRSQLSAQFPCGHQRPQVHNKQESTTFIHPYGSNKQHSMDKEEFHWLCVVVCHAGLMSIKTSTWVKKSVMDPSCQHNFLAATNSHRDITNRNEPLLFIHMDPTNSIVWTRKSFIGSLVSCGVGFHQNFYLGQKSVMDPSCQHDSLRPPTATGT
jgi:hypothetical protein